MKVLCLLLMVLLFVCVVYLNESLSSAYGSIDSSKGGVVNREADEEGPLITANDEDLVIELVTKGLNHPTTMAFLGVDEILVLEKNNGTVRKIIGDTVLKEPLLAANVSSYVELGLLGIAIGDTGISHNDSGTRDEVQVFLYFTEGSNEADCIDQGESGLVANRDCVAESVLGHRLYKYKVEENRLIDPKLILDLPENPSGSHVGGVLAVGPEDRNIYLMTGDGESCQDNGCKNGIDDTLLNAQSANVIGGNLPEGRGGILRITPDGEAVADPITGDYILGDDYPLNLYYAYGIRNSFGMDFDPMTGNLWATENGPGFGDEINLVEPGFNSGWAKIAGIWPITNYELLNSTPEQKGYFNTTEISEETDNLVEFNNRVQYSSPKLSLNESRGLTAIKFLSSDRLGDHYENDMFVGDVGGDLYHFNLKDNRTRLDLDGKLDDEVANSPEELEDVIIARKFPPIVDLEVSPDGYLYILTYDGSLFKMYKG